MTTDTEAPAVIKAVVACGTCDSVYRAHPGRQTCPCCGGDPDLIIIDLFTAESEAAAQVDTAAEGVSAEPAPGEVTPPEVTPPQDLGPSTTAGTEEEPAAPAAAASGKQPSSRRRLLS